MSQLDIKFVAADMDGTLLDENSQLNPDFFDIYQQLENKGILFAAASGRQYYSLIDTFAPVKDNMLFVAENGTLVMHQGQETLQLRDRQTLDKKHHPISSQH